MSDIEPQPQPSSAANSIPPCSNEPEPIEVEENHISTIKKEPDMTNGVETKTDKEHGDVPATQTGENGGTPMKETVVDMVTTPIEEGKKVGSAKKSSSKKASAKKETSSGYTPKKSNSGKISYLEMTHEAIATLKDRTGSSAIAIQKWVKANYPDKVTAKPDLFKNLMYKAIKQGLKDKRFIQIKASYKINSEYTKQQKAAAKAKEAAKKKAAAKVKKDLEKAKAKINEEDAKKKAEEEQKRKEVEMTPEQKAAAAKAKAKAELLRKRRLPMEDTQLHAENKEYGIKNPEALARRPAMPYTLTSLVPPHLRSGDNPKWGPVNTASQTGVGEWTESDNDRGLIADALHVYHFFCGDVGFEDEKFPVPKFSVKTLLYAINEIIIGNSKAAKSLPPLISHLFLTALRVLTSAPASDQPQNVEYIDPIEAQLQKDLSKIRLGLNSISWSQVLFFYMDLMERYYLSDSSLDVGVLPGDDDLDMSYLWSKSENDDVAKPDIQTSSPSAGRVYRGYLGNPKGAFCRAYTKLSHQVEPWNLSAEELMASLRALTDDILSRRADLSADITERGLKLDELKRAKNSALQKFRKARADFEGPKRPNKKKKESGESDKKKDGDESENAGDNGKAEDESGIETEKEEPFKPKISKKEFLAAEKAYNKALEAFDNGIRKLVSRTEPLGFDRNFNSYYCFVHDPSMMHVEQLKQTNLPPEIKRLGLTLNPSSSWHFIDTKALFEQFLDCLDIRGTRENELYEVSSTLTVLKRKLQDDKKENTRAVARIREREALEKKLENARTACDAEEGRRSGRLAGQAIDEVRKLEVELEQMLEAHGEEERLEKLGRERACDYSLLTGLQSIAELGSGQNIAIELETFPCHELWMSKKAGGNGTIKAVADALLELEAMCHELSPWRRKDIDREAWRKQLSDASTKWAKECVMRIGPSSDEKPKESPVKDGNSESQSPTKKQRVDDRPFMANIVSVIRICLKELELRVFELSGEKMAFEEADAVEDAAASDDEEDKEEIKRRQCWKRKINALKQIPTAKYNIIRDIIIAAITVARKSHLNQIAADLKVALQLHRPHAAGEAKVAAMGVLEKYGGYDDEDDDMDLDELAAVGGDKSADDVVQIVSSFLCDEITMMTGSIGGNEDADKCDWRDVLKSCRSISRLAAAAQMFLSKAEDVIYRVQEEKEALDMFLGSSNKKSGKSKTSKRKFDLSSPVWADCKVTDELVKGKVKDYPWWPARVCEPYDPAVAQAITESEHTLISFVGESINYLVPRENIKPFSGEAEESTEKFDAETLNKLNESMAMAKNIWKRQNPGLMSPWSKKSKPRFIEEKKSES